MRRLESKKPNSPTILIEEQFDKALLKEGFDI